MSEDIMLMESAGPLEPAHGLIGLTSPDIRMGSVQNNGRQQLSMPLGPKVALTGYRLLTTGVILGLGIPKAVYSYYGQSLISSTLDLLGGIVFGLLLFWLGVIEATNPELCPCFFQVDLAPAILRFLRDRNPPPLHVFESHYPTFPIPSIPGTYPSTDSRDPDNWHPDTVTSLPYYNLPPPSTVIQGGAHPGAQNSSYLDMNEREVDLADFMDEDLALCAENTLFTYLSGAPLKNDTVPSKYNSVPSKNDPVPSKNNSVPSKNNSGRLSGSGYLLIRWRAKKLAKHADYQLSQTRLLLDARGAEMQPDDRDIIRERLFFADDLRAGLDIPRLAQLRQARVFCDWAEETLHVIEAMLMLVPRTKTGFFRRWINS